MVLLTLMINIIWFHNQYSRKEQDCFEQFLRIYLLKSIITPLCRVSQNIDVISHLFVILLSAFSVLYSPHLHSITSSWNHSMYTVLSNLRHSLIIAWYNIIFSHGFGLFQLTSALCTSDKRLRLQAGDDSVGTYSRCIHYSSRLENSGTAVPLLLPSARFELAPDPPPHNVHGPLLPSLLLQ